MVLYADIPVTKAQESCIKRARQLTSVQWYTRGSMPTNFTLFADGTPNNFIRMAVFTNPWQTNTGVPYSSCRASERFIGFNVSLETFMTALQNPHSVLYRRNLHGTGGGSVSSYYGCVCSCLVSYVTGRSYRTPCKVWPTLENVTEIDPEQLENLQLCDLLDKPQKHIAIITGIWRDENGKVRKIEVSESTPPVAISCTYEAEQFRHRWLERGFRVFRCALPEDLSYTPSVYAPLEGEQLPDAPEYDIMTNWGHKVNCLLGEESVDLSVLKGEWDTFCVVAPDGTERRYPAGAMVEVDCPTVGDYTAFPEKDGKTGTAVTWHIHDLKLDVSVTGEGLTLHFKNAEADPVFHYVINKESSNSIATQCDVTAEEAAAGAVNLPLLPAGRYWAIVTAKNEYGAYVSNHVPFEIPEN